MCDSVTLEDDESDSVTAEGDDVFAEGDDVSAADPKGV